MSVTEIRFDGYKYHPTKMPDSFVTDKRKGIHEGDKNEGYTDAGKINGDTLKTKLVSKSCKECADAFIALNESADKQLEHGSKSEYAMNESMIKYHTKELKRINEGLCEK